MNPRTADGETLKVRRCRTKPEAPKGQCYKGRKRPTIRNVESSEPPTKKLRIQENLLAANKHYRKAEGKALSQPLRKSTRQQALYKSNTLTQILPQKQASLSLKARKTNTSIGQRQSQILSAATQTRKSPLSTSTTSSHEKRNSQAEVVFLPPPDREGPGNQAQLAPGSITDNARLTSKNLKRVTRETNSQKLSSPDETVLRQWEFVNMAKTKKNDTESSGTSKPSSSGKTFSTTDYRFPKLAKQNGILDKTQSIEPSNIDMIRTSLKRSRNSPPPEVKDFKKFCRNVRVAQNESDIQRAVLPLLKYYDDEIYNQTTNQQFTKFPSNVGFNDGLSAPKPDFIEGYLEEAFEPYPVRDLLGGSAVSTPADYPIALPHIAGEFKRYGGDFKCGTCQAAYDAASLVYGRNQAGISMGKIDKANTAYVGSFVCDGDQLLISVHYSAKNALGKTVYHHCPVFVRNIRADHETFVLGRQQLRNLQDWAKENACSIKDNLIVHYERSEAQTKKSIALEIPGNYDFSEGWVGASGEIIEEQDCDLGQRT